MALFLSKRLLTSIRAEESYRNFGGCHTARVLCSLGAVGNSLATA